MDGADVMVGCFWIPDDLTWKLGQRTVVLLIPLYKLFINRLKIWILRPPILL